MLEKFGEWFHRYNTEITWWLIGWLSLAAIHEIQNGALLGAVIDIGLAYFNYHMWKTRS